MAAWRAARGLAVAREREVMFLCPGLPGPRNRLRLLATRPARGSAGTCAFVCGQISSDCRPTRHSDGIVDTREKWSAQDRSPMPGFLNLVLTRRNVQRIVHALSVLLVGSMLNVSDEIVHRQRRPWCHTAREDAATHLSADDEACRPRRLVPGLASGRSGDEPGRFDVQVQSEAC